MTLLTLTATSLTAGGTTPTNLTTAYQAIGTNTGVIFPNSGKVVLAVSVGAGTAVTATSDIALTIQGQSVTGQSSGALGTSTVYLLGPWPSQFDRVDGTYDVEVDFAPASAGATVALLAIPGVT